MGKKIITMIFTIVVLSAMALSASADPPWPGTGFAGGFISLDCFTASNATYIPSIYGGDVLLSGDINSNLQYRGISDQNQFFLSILKMDL